MRVTLVEDEPKLAALIAKGLSEEGGAVDVTASGAEAIWFATEHAGDARRGRGVGDGEGV